MIGFDILVTLPVGAASHRWWFPTEIEAGKWAYGTYPSALRVDVAWISCGALNTRAFTREPGPAPPVYRDPVERWAVLEIDPAEAGDPDR